MATADAYNNAEHRSSAGKAQIDVSVRKLSLNAVSHRTLCGTFVEQLLSQPVVEYAALWVRTGLMHQAPLGGYELAKELPEKGAARQLHPDNQLANWAQAAGPFGWSISDCPGPTEPHAESGFVLVFAQDEELILLLHISDEGAEITGVQSSLAELGTHLHTATRYSASPRTLGPVEVDMAFLEAMAMGDEAFVLHMLALQLRLLCSLSAPWPENFEACSSPLYKTLV